jgi:hypothetical protein
MLVSKWAHEWESEISQASYQTIIYAVMMKIIIKVSAYFAISTTKLAQYNKDITKVLV